MPREPLDALENLPKEAPRQVAFGELQGEVSGMSDEMDVEGLKHDFQSPKPRPVRPYDLPRWSEVGAREGLRRVLAHIFDLKVERSEG